MKTESLKEFATTFEKRGILVRTVGWVRTAIKKFKKAERAIDGDEDELVLCSLMRESKKENVKKKKVQFAEDVKQLSEAGMMCTIDGNTFFCSQRIPG